MRRRLSSLDIGENARSQRFEGGHSKQTARQGECDDPQRYSSFFGARLTIAGGPTRQLAKAIIVPVLHEGPYEGPVPSCRILESWLSNLRRHPSPLRPGARGCCCARQCSVPSPSAMSTQCTPRTSRSGKHSRKIPSAAPSLESLNVGTSTVPLAT